MKKNILFNSWIVLLFFALSINGYSQDSSTFWDKVSDEATISAERWNRIAMPLKYDTYNLNLDLLFSQLQNAPSRKQSSISQGIVVDFPSITEGYEKYEVYDASVLAPELQEELPNIRSFVGKSLKDANKIVRFSISLFGLKAVILNAKEGTQYIDCLTKDRASYIMYLRQNVSPEENGIECLTDDQSVELPSGLESTISEDEFRNANDGQFREFRLALSCTEEYATYHVNQAGLGSASTAIKKDAVLAVMNDIMTRVNAVYENELAVTMTIVNNNRNVIFITDTFLTNNNIGVLINESQTFIDGFIAEAYDIGHMLSTSGSGLAQLFTPCTSNKARGVSGGLGGVPEGVVYENVIMHEMGHQFGAFHTWSAPGCSGTYTNFSAAEPGGGTTIMAYAGICGNSANIQPVADTYFHQISLQQMWANITIGNSTCAQQTATGNGAPTANAGGDFTIPFGTPYKLVGSGTDDGSSLSYCWEQLDVNGPEALPGDFTIEGPIVRSFPPETNSTRYIPRLADYVNIVNSSTSWEKIVLVNRDVNYELTVRDNDISGGQTASDGMTVTVTNTSGPFVVTSQNAFDIVYDGNTTQTITWNVANTDSGLVSSSNVNILLSTDGGLTFDTMLLANTPNDGTQDITIPNTIDSTTCRFMVESADNIFYNINRRDFEIRASLSLDDNSFANNLSIYPNPNSGEFSIKFTSNNFNDDVNIQLFDIRGRSIFKNIYDGANEFDETISLSNVQSGVYLVSISNGNNKVTKKIVIQ
ncbi:M12 family metallo-peptidase [uncultured Psychroserpens sp.]|uniref:zinc-dependent metalloprotease n=1 Tax=uncultured Psychroserpens sp. TaxID=255436 RepID=UPI0026164937|nr:M12 family metallo-peptidase [uncultured Psychroserpens sp.]